VDVRRELARVTALDRPWQLLADRHTRAGAVAAGAPGSDEPSLDLSVAVAVVDGRDPGAVPRPQAVAAASGWHDVLLFLAATARVRPVVVDEGLVRTLHWLLQRHRPGSEAGQVRPGVDLRLPPPPPGADAIDAAIWTGAAVRRAEPCTTGSLAVAHAVEVLLLAQADDLPPWYAGRPAPTGDPREVLQTTAAAHLQRCREAEQRWFAVTRALAAAHLSDRMAGPCWAAAAGLPLTNTSYRAAAAIVRPRPISEQQASRDLGALVDAGLLQPTGRTRDRTYRWSG
jgi:hypothetical protein